MMMAERAAAGAAGDAGEVNGVGGAAAAVAGLVAGTEAAEAAGKKGWRVYEQRWRMDWVQFHGSQRVPWGSASSVRRTREADRWGWEVAAVAEKREAVVVYTAGYTVHAVAAEADTDSDSDSYLQVRYSVSSVGYTAEPIEPGVQPALQIPEAPYEAGRWS